ncbi:MAG: DUF2752 domain-containing protein [Pirellulaceae bacterium]
MSADQVAVEITPAVSVADGAARCADESQLVVEGVEGAPSPGLGFSTRGRVIYHLGLLMLSTLVIALAITMSVEQRSRVTLPGMSVPLPELCASKRMLNYPCPGCGMTRAFISLGHGRIIDAWGFNPAALLLFPIIALQLPWRIVQLWRVRRGKPDLEPRGMTTVAMLLMIGMLVQWLAQVVSDLIIAA